MKLTKDSDMWVSLAKWIAMNVTTEEYQVIGNCILGDNIQVCLHAHNFVITCL